MPPVGPSEHPGAHVAARATVPGRHADDSEHGGHEVGDRGPGLDPVPALHAPAPGQPRRGAVGRQADDREGRVLVDVPCGVEASGEPGDGLVETGQAGAVRPEVDRIARTVEEAAGEELGHGTRIGGVGEHDLDVDGPPAAVLADLAKDVVDGLAARLPTGWGQRQDGDVGTARGYCRRLEHGVAAIGQELGQRRVRAPEHGVGRRIACVDPLETHSPTRRGGEARGGVGVASVGGQLVGANGGRDDHDDVRSGGPQAGPVRSRPSPQDGDEQQPQHPPGASRPGQWLSPLRSTPAYRGLALAALLVCAPPAFAGDELPNPDAEDAAIGLVWRLYDTEGPERAEQFLEDWVAAHPDAVDARLLRARMASWTGRFPEARAEIERARDLAPDSPQVEVTRAGVELLAGRPGEAARAVRAAQGIDPHAAGLADVAGLLGDATRPWAAGTTTFASETSGIDRTTASAGLVSWVAAGTTLDVAADVASFRSADDAFVRSGVGGRIAQELPLDFRLDVGLSAQWVAGHPVRPRWNAEVGWSFPGVGSVGLGVRRRAIVDDPVVHGTALPPLVGTAGAGMEDIADGLDQDEAFLRASVVPVQPLSVWVEGSWGAIDGNRRASLSAGAIWDVLATTGGPHVLGVRYELYVLSFEHAVSDYYSPQAANSHAPGLEWHWTTDAGHRIVALAAPILQPGGPPGEMLGVSARFHVARRLDFGLGLRHQGNKYYRITGATASLEGRL